MSKVLEESHLNLKEVMDKIETLQNDTRELRTFIEENIKSKAAIEDPKQKDNIPGKPSQTTASNDTSESTNESIASFEEFMTDIPELQESLLLNLILPTNQL